MPDSLKHYAMTEQGYSDYRLDATKIALIAAEGPMLVAVIRSVDYSFIYANTRFEQYLGYSAKEIAGGLRFTELLEDYQLNRFYFLLKNITEVKDTQSQFTVFKIKDKSGARKPFYLSAALSNSENGAYHLVLQPDLSKWDMPFTSFNTRELFLQQFNSEDFGTFEWIIEFDKVYWSTGIYNIYEVDHEKEIDYRFVSSFVHPADKGKLNGAVKQSIETGNDLSIEFRIITARNNVKTILTLGRTIKNKEGVAVLYTGSVWDVTRQRAIEDDLKNKVEELNHSNRELEEFAYMASHDMQEPLRKISTFSDRLSDKYKDILKDEGTMYLKRIIASAENMRSLINDLLEFSKISKTSQSYELVDLNIVYRQVKTDLELIIEETSTQFDEKPLPIVKGIPSQMKQLFTNIINNAIKFRKPNVTPLIKIDTSSPSDEELQKYELNRHSKYCKISITDNGIGFENEYALRIFQVFQRLHGKADYPGSGIGLAICKKILEYHHGVIFAENVPDTGARFVFILPVLQLS